MHLLFPFSFNLFFLILKFCIYFSFYHCTCCWTNLWTGGL
ncbi:hypothetical protein ZEAMMB73_Zm00001d034772 [Zea mays]|uniref:Uncharacterized protein n=1 Tax=Zea mays TaxID=4577 RepID=A0A1D6LB76_MAIZE|nr:hypothetical protein ZEAMMB73_Zm00001d034772 [Zea mays]